LISGRLPVTYALNGPISFPPQASNVFSGLSGGNYNVLVTDSCGETKVVTYSLTQYTPNFQITQNGGVSDLTSCDLIRTSYSFGSVTPGSAIFWPVQLQITAYPPVGPPVVINTTLGAAGDPPLPAPFTSQRIINIPYFPTAYSYDMVFTDACGNVYSVLNTAVNTPPNVNLASAISTCSQRYINMDATAMLSPVVFTIIGAPVGYTGPISDTSADSYATGSFGSPSNPLPDGIYTIQAVDSCGNIDTTSITLTTTVVNQNFYTVSGCGVGNASFYLYGAAVYLDSATVISYTPPVDFPGNVFPHPLPYDASSHIQNSGVLVGGVSNQNTLRFDSYPAGTYVIQTVDSCGIVRTQTVVATGYTNGIVNISENYLCSAFSVNLSISGSSGTAGYQKYYIQKFYPDSNKWGHPITGVLYSGTGDLINSGLFLSSQQNPTLTSPTISNNFGTFRVIKVYQSSNFPCQEVLKEFTYTLEMKLKDAYVFGCSNGTYNLGITATGGVPPLGYRIINPIFVDNGPNNLFTGLAGGTYTVQVYDSCGNTLNTVLDIVTLGLPAITPINLCAGENGRLIVNGVSYLNFEWFNNANPAIILSTTDSLNFNNFNPATDAGTYSVHLTSSVAGSCIDDTLTFTISTNPSNPSAGNDDTVSVCNSIVNVNLNNYLTGIFDVYGTWSEITASGLLSNNIWNSNLAPNGTYQFKYKVNGQCIGSDSSIITIVLKDCNLSITGTVFNDGNGLTDSTVNGIGTNVGGLNAVLVDAATGNVLAVVPVAIDGTYIFEGLASGNYNVLITTSTATIGATAPSVVLAPNWVSTGDNVGTDPGNDGFVNSIITNIVLDSTSIIDVNFGIEELPNSNNVMQTIPSPSINTIAAGTITQPVAGLDFEDGVLGNTNTLVITALPANATMYYNGSLVTIGQIIQGFDPLLISYTDITLGSNAIQFEYAFIDSAGMQDLSPATYTIDWAVPLPVYNIVFNAIGNICNVDLQWSVTQELNFSHYEVLRSHNASSFVKIGTVQASNGQGEKNYSYIDEQLTEGEYTYKLKVVDIDNTFDYTTTKSVLIRCEEEALTVFPNPTSDMLHVNIKSVEASYYVVNIYDAVGKLVMSTDAELNENEYKQLTFSLAQYSNGFYYVHVISDGNKEVYKVLKQ
jgi:hypothetical protein